MTWELRKKNEEELKIVQKNNLLNVEYSSCHVFGSQNGREKLKLLNITGNITKSRNVTGL